MNALEHVKELGREKAIAEIEASGICNYGVYPWNIADRWRTVLSAGNLAGVKAALNNADVEGILLEVLRQAPEAVLEGLQITMAILGAAEGILQLPQMAAALSEQLEPLAKQRNIRIQTGFINIRDETDMLWMHIVTMKELSDYFNNKYEKGIYVSVNHAEINKYSAVCKISELVEAEGIKAVQIGYHLYPPAVLNRTLAEIEVPNGVINTVTDKACLVCEAEQRSMDFRKSSCGQCVFCREGLIQLNSMLRDIAEGKGKNEYLELAKEVGGAMKFSTLCSLGQEAAGYVIDTIEYFSEELTAHIKKWQCPAMVCKSFQLIYIDPQACEGCGECMEVCPADCIEGKRGFIHMIDDFECMKCGKCMDACESGAIVRTTGRLPKLPSRLVKCGKFKKH